MLETFSIILNLLPAIIQAIKAIEGALPGNSPGAAKLEAVIGIMTAADESIKPMVPQITTVIGHLVKLFNVTGVFSSKT